MKLSFSLIYLVFLFISNNAIGIIVDQDGKRHKLPYTKKVDNIQKPTVDTGEPLYKKQKPYAGKVIDFSNQDLSGEDLSYYYFDYANFEGTDLEGVNLSRSRIRLTNFSGANAEGANFFNANAGWANFSGTNLEDASFEGAYVGGADFRTAIITTTTLWIVETISVNFKGAIYNSKTQFPPDFDPKAEGMIEEKDLGGKTPLNRAAFRTWTVK